MSVAYVTHRACREHRVPEGHPEVPERLLVIEEALMEQGVWDFLVPLEAPRCIRADLERVHDGAYVDRILEGAPREGFHALDEDTFMSPGSAEAALRAAGAAVLATEKVLAGDFRRAFCAVRPPGHHASRSRAMGFCLFNNVAVAAAYALGPGGLDRISVLDFDAHRGNGTEALFAGDDRLQFCSMYQQDLFPPPRSEAPAANVVEVALRPGSDGEALRAALQTVWLPALERHAPQLVLVSAGFDGHILDDLSALRLRDSDYRWISELCVACADSHAQGRVVSVLEGGYHLPSLGRCAAAHVRVLMGL
ncbi:MAG: histone deacetylase family protein [Pseudomonadales bacterium]|jgi:acetoin utilization deacetylase AcuC-like enzyme|nr:histone deacetylase family protein [Pseudomonadales bacterium]